jgi:hypothetical protein
MRENLNAKIIRMLKVANLAEMDYNPSMEARDFMAKVGILFSLILIGMTGCVSVNAPFSGVTNAKQTTADSGYALLYDLMGSEKDVSKLLIIKRERTEFHDLIQDISKRCGEAHDRLTAFGKADPSLNLKDRRLPLAETLTRQREGKARGKELLGSKGKDLELNLLLTQVEALTYATHLSAVTAEGEANPERAQFLQQLSTDVSQLAKRVNGMLLKNYAWTKE